MQADLADCSKVSRETQNSIPTEQVYFGDYTGQWRFNQDETEITIVTDSLALPIICDIELLTKEDLKINTVVPNPFNQQDQIDIRMTFKAK